MFRVSVGGFLSPPPSNKVVFRTTWRTSDSAYRGLSFLWPASARFYLFSCFGSSCKLWRADFPSWAWRYWQTLIHLYPKQQHTNTTLCRLLPDGNRSDGEKKKNLKILPVNQIRPIQNHLPSYLDEVSPVKPPWLQEMSFFLFLKKGGLFFHDCNPPSGEKTLSGETCAQTSSRSRNILVNYIWYPCTLQRGCLSEYVLGRRLGQIILVSAHVLTWMWLRNDGNCFTQTIQNGVGWLNWE